MMQTSTIVALSVGTVVTGLLGMYFDFELNSIFCHVGSSVHVKVLRLLTDCGVAYAVYFDHKRRTDPEFRKALKREARKQARMVKEAKESEGKQQKEAIKRAVEEAQEEGFPSSIEDREAFFMKEVAQGEAYNGEGTWAAGYQTRLL
jgi:MAS20 protein import receptor